MRSQGIAILLSLAAIPAAARAQAPGDQPPVTLQAGYILDTFGNVGGIKDGAAVLGRGDLTASFNGSAIGLPRGEIYVDLMTTNGSQLSSRLVGDAQTVDNIDAPNSLRPLEAWAQYYLTRHLRAKLGLIDLNAEFDVQDVGALFLNSSAGIGPAFSQSGKNGPSIFPITSSGAILDYRFRHAAVRIGLFDALAGSTVDPNRLVIRWPGADGSLLVGEVDLQLADSATLRFGAWRYGHELETLLPQAGRGRSEGAYGVIEGQLWHDRSDRLRLDSWIQIGLANDTVNQIGAYAGGGFVLHSGSDKLGLAAYQARLGDPAIAAAALDGTRRYRAETTFELTWSHRVLDYLTLQPDMQYVIHPSWRPDRSNALVFAC